MAIADYNPNIPQASDQLSVSQGQLLLNFSALQQWLAVNHVDYATSGAGKHKWVSLPVQSPNSPPTGAFAANEVGLYSFQNPQTTKNELYINKEDGTQVPITACSSGTSGYFYLPCGFLVKFYTVTFTGSTQALDISGNPVNYTAPPFATFTANINATGFGGSVNISTATATSVNVIGNNGVQAMIFLIGV